LLILLPDALRLVLRVSEELFFLRKLKLDLRGAPGCSPLDCAMLGTAAASGEASRTVEFRKLGGLEGVVLAMMGGWAAQISVVPTSRACNIAGSKEKGCAMGGPATCEE
jgi:hypothetical protein